MILTPREPLQENLVGLKGLQASSFVPDRGVRSNIFGGNNGIASIEAHTVVIDLAWKDSCFVDIGALLLPSIDMSLYLCAYVVFNHALPISIDRY